MARMPSTLGERAVPRPTRRMASFDPSAGISLTRRGAAAVGDGYDDIASGLQAASNALYEEQLKDEERAVKNLEVEWSKKRREILFGDGTPNKPGFYSTSGEDTLNNRKGVEEALNKARSQLLGKAGNSRVKEAFDLSSNASLQGELEQVDRYTIAQRREANILSAQASIEEAQQQAATYFSDDNKWEGAVDRIAYEVASLGDEQGWSQETINTETQKAISKAARARINHALLTDAASGEAIYAKTKDMIDGDLRIEIEQDIKQAKKAEEVEKRLAEAERRQALADLDKAAFTEHATAILTGSADPKAIAMDSRLDGQSKLALANALEARANKEPTTNHVTWNNAFARIHYPEGHPDKITDWHELIPLQREMKFSDWEQLRQEVIKNGTPEGKADNDMLQRVLDAAKGTLLAENEMLGWKDPKGQELLTRAYNNILKAFDEGKKKGLSAYEMTDPDNPNYVGKIINQLKRSPDQVIKDVMDDSVGGEFMEADEATPGGPGARAVPQSDELPVIVTDEDFAKLPKGAKFKDENGKVYTKP